MNQEERIPAHPPVAHGELSEEPRRLILMTPLMCTLGAVLVFMAVAVVVVVILPTFSMNPPPSVNWAPYTDNAMYGRALYNSNGCVYCHSYFTRPNDYIRAPYYLYPRISEPGDYWRGEPSPNIFGTARTGPDLSQEGGQHPADWEKAHFWSPRATTPISVMPRFNFLSDRDMSELTAFLHESGGKEGYLRTATQEIGGTLMGINMGLKDPEKEFPDLVNQLKASGEYKSDGKPDDMSPWGLPWKAVWMVNSFERGYWLEHDPLPLNEQNLLRGKVIFLERCAGCHGYSGDGGGPASDFLLPNPFNFQDTESVMGPFGSDGMFYHRILTAGKGTAMENFGTRLSVEDIWRVVLFVRTIQNGSMAEEKTLPTMDMWVEWTPPPPLLKYVDDHPIRDGPGVIKETKSDPFSAAAHWAAPGLAPGDIVLVGGKLPMSTSQIAQLIQNKYMNKLEQAYNETQARGGVLPDKASIMSTEGLQFHAP